MSHLRPAGRNTLQVLATASALLLCMLDLAPSCYAASARRMMLRHGDGTCPDGTALLGDACVGVPLFYDQAVPFTLGRQAGESLAATFDVDVSGAGTSMYCGDESVYGPAAWFRFKASQPGVVTIETDGKCTNNDRLEEFESVYDTVLAVGFNPWTCIAYADGNGVGRCSRVTFDVREGEEYAVALLAYPGTRQDLGSVTTTFSFACNTDSGYQDTDTGACVVCPRGTKLSQGEGKPSCIKDACDPNPCHGSCLYGETYATYTCECGGGAVWRDGACVGGSPWHPSLAVPLALVYGEPRSLQYDINFAGAAVSRGSEYCGDDRPSNYFKFIPRGSGVVTVATSGGCSNFESYPILRLYGPESDTRCIAYDQAWSMLGTACSQITHSVEPGQEYTVIVASRDGAALLMEQTTITFLLDCPGDTMPNAAFDACEQGSETYVKV